MYFVPVYQCTSTHPQGVSRLSRLGPRLSQSLSGTQNSLKKGYLALFFCFAPLICSKNEDLFRFEPFDVFLAKFIPFLNKKAHKLYSSQL